MILLDANILLEAFIEDRSNAESVQEWYQNNESPVCISLLTVHLVLHFGLKAGRQLSEIQAFLADYTQEALLPEDYVSAMQFIRNRDHEDALQLAVANRSNCRAIVTLDKKFASTYRDVIPFTVLGS